MWDFKLKSFLHDLKNHTEKPPALRKGCDVTGCDHLGEHRAPRARQEVHATAHKGPNSRSFYWFCLEHVREYNANWDFFKGMTKGEMEEHLYKTTVWDRPTWRSDKTAPFTDAPRQKIYEHFAGDNVTGKFGFGSTEEAEEETHIHVGVLPHPTIEALAVMNLTPPVQWDEVKARYKTLAKKHHPDTNAGNKEAEEQFKKITLAYTILKLSYENYSKLDER
jgi:hypothetical protein